jgi:hypothetical protein
MAPTHLFIVCKGHGGTFRGRWDVGGDLLGSGDPPRVWLTLGTNISITHVASRNLHFN